MPELNPVPPLPTVFTSEGERASHEALPAYRCHKVVRAAKVKTIDFIIEPEPGAPPDPSPIQPIDLLELETGHEVMVRRDWLDREGRRLVVGDYVVIYADGYLSWSPAKAFEDGYTRIVP